jgi:acetolactate synthase-1/2/3 large subunit
MALGPDATTASQTGPAGSVGSVAAGEAVPVGRVGPDVATASRVAALLERAERPVAILGRGAQLEPEAALRVVQRFGLGVYTAFRRQDAIPNGHPQYLGHLGLGTAGELLAPLREADLVLALGTRLSEITTQGYELPTAPVVQVDRAPEVLGALHVPCSVGAFAAAVVGEPVQRDWSAAHEVYLRLSAPPELPPSSPVHPAAVIAALLRTIPPDAIVVNDAGNFSQFGHRYWRFEHPHSQLGPTSGAMGYAVPAAIGAQLASAPGRRVVALAGDGGFLMTGQELETAARLCLPILVVVFQNGLYGTIALHQARASGRLAGVEIGDVDLAGYARALGADAVTVEHSDQLDAALAPRPTDRPRVVVVHTDPDVITPTTSLAAALDRR